MKKITPSQEIIRIARLKKHEKNSLAEQKRVRKKIKNNKMQKIKLSWNRQLLNWTMHHIELPVGIPPSSVH